MSMRFNLLYAVAGLPAVGLGLPGAAWSQTRPTPPSFYTTYNYTGYTVYDNTSSEPPTVVSGVGGRLVLRPDGSYEKHMSIVTPGGPHYFNQTGRYVLSGDSIRFMFSDRKGDDTQKGTFQFDPATRHLTLTIFGYPVGNKGVYELAPAPPLPQRPAKPAARRAKSAKKAIR